MLTREQSVNLRRGQVVRLTVFEDKSAVGRIASITVPAKGKRVVEIDSLVLDGLPFPIAGLWVGSDALELVR